MSRAPKPRRELPRGDARGRGAVTRGRTVRGELRSGKVAEAPAHVPANRREQASGLLVADTGSAPREAHDEGRVDGEHAGERGHQQPGHGEAALGRGVPPIEQNLGVVAPVEGHVHHLVVGERRVDPGIPKQRSERWGGACLVTRAISGYSQRIRQTSKCEVSNWIDGVGRLGAVLQVRRFPASDLRSIVQPSPGTARARRRRPSATASAPGKVLLAGGYLVLERPNPGYVIGASARFHSQVYFDVSARERRSPRPAPLSPAFSFAGRGSGARGGAARCRAQPAVPGHVCVRRDVRPRRRSRRRACLVSCAAVPPPGAAW